MIDAGRLRTAYYASLGVLTSQFAAQRGGAGKRVVITENGWPTCPAGYSASCVSQSQQASYTSAAIARIDSSYTNVDGYFNYHWALTTAGAANDNAEAFYGLIDGDGVGGLFYKPAYFTYQGVVAKDP